MSTPTPYRILIVDDNAAIHEDFRKILTNPASKHSLETAESILFERPAPNTAKRSEFEIDSAYQSKEAIELVEKAEAEGRPYALAFIDIRMPPGNDGIQTLQELWKISPDLQAVLCTAYSDYTWDKMIELLGINDSLVILKKPFDNIEVLQLAHALTKKWQMTRSATLRFQNLDRIVHERTRDLESASAELGQSEERFAKAFKSSPVALAIQSAETQRFVDMNAGFEALTGFARAELHGRTPHEVGLVFAFETPSGPEQRNQEAEVLTKKGEKRHALVSTEIINLGGTPHILTLAQDVTDRLRLESQLRQAQKLEAVGQLAAGIAHDFNNLLTIIQGHSSLQLATETLAPSQTEAFTEIEQAAQRASNLTRQLLTFSRRHLTRPRVLDVNGLVKDIGGMLSRLIGENISLQFSLGPDLPSIYGDQTNIEQILMNLALNARDAIPKRGTISITTCALTLDENDSLAHPDAKQGAYIRLSVTDTGSGMDEATAQRIFEPFFTTKQSDKGTGMGLATVYGIVKQHEGWIDVITAPGKGSTFHVYLPVTDKLPSDDIPLLQTENFAPKESYTVLLVEDEDSVRKLVRDILGLDGFSVLEAANADEAVHMWKDKRPPIDLLLTDLVMPGDLSGLELAKLLQSELPNLKVVYTSGYSSNLFSSDVALEEGVNYLPKPYVADKLVEIARRAVTP